MKPIIFLVTGGLGFIGKHFIKQVLSQGHYVINVDKITYAADIKVIDEFSGHYQFGHIGIEQLNYLTECDYIINFAAESHVDNSISDSKSFVNSNILGVQNLIELIRIKRKDRQPKLIHISTDEVYGDIQENNTEEDKLYPSSPYAASKAAADLLLQAWGRTYDMDFNIVRLSNTYGDHQYPEKLIPKTCMCLSRGLPVPIHGTGQYERTWLHVSDAIAGILIVIDKGKNREIYNISGMVEINNLAIVDALARLYKFPVEKAVKYTEERPGQDSRYSMNYDKIKKLGWDPKANMADELKVIVKNFDIGRFTQSWKGKMLNK